MEIKGKELFLKHIGNYKSLFFIDSVKLAQISVFLFFSYDFLQTGLNWVLGASRFSTFLCLLIIYTPVFIGIILYPKKFIKFDFILLLSFVICFFLLSLLFHPDYDYFYLRSGYGVWDHVLVPYRGIYAYYFVRLLSDQPIKLTTSIKAAGLAMMMYFIYSIYAAHMRGYWLGVVGDNGAAHLTYSVEFGYKVLPFCILFLNEGFKKKWFWLILGIVTSGMVFCMVLEDQRFLLFYLFSFIS